MVICSIKSKKAIQLAAESVGIIFSILGIALVIVILSYSGQALGDDITEDASEVESFSYQNFVYIFLMKEVSTDDTKKIDSLSQDQSYSIIDLLWYDDLKVQDLIDSQRLLYIEDFKNQLETQRHRYAQKLEISTDDLLIIEKVDSVKVSLQDQIEKENYFFTLRNKEGKFVIIYFRRLTS